MKKILSLILTCSLLAVAIFAVSCKGKQSSLGVVEKLEIDESNLMLTLGDTEKLNAYYNEIEGATLSWSSTAEKIVSVDSDGNLNALGVGKATIKAKYGSKEASCSVEVGLLGNVPTLSIDNVSNNKITVVKGEEFNLETSVTFNGKSFKDGEISYFVSDPSVGTVTDGKFKAENKEGEVSISVTGTWRGQSLHAVSITVKVIADTTVLLNGGKLTSIELYTTQYHAGKEYVTEQVISSVSIFEDGTQINDFEFEILRPDIALIEKDGSEWVVRPLKAGNTKLIVKYGSGKEYPYDIMVTRPVSQFSGEFDYSLTDGKYYDDGFKNIDSLISGFNLKTYAYGGLEYNTNDGSITVPVGENRVVTLYDGVVGYEVNFNVYTLLIDELSDFEQIYAGDGSVVTGMYALVKDIIEPETIVTMPSGKIPNDFSGTFDGRGHVLSFTFKHGSSQRFGLFGKFLKGATIKNVAFNNVTTDGTTGSTSAGLLCAESVEGSSLGLLKNVYVNLSFDTQSSYACNLVLMYNINQSMLVENVIIDVPTVPVTETYGSFTRGNASAVSHSYVISSAKLHVSPDDPNSTRFTKLVPKLYDSYQSLLSEVANFSTFSLEYWDVATFGVPVWKSLVGNFTM